MGKTKHHLCMDIQGALNQHPRDFEQSFTSTVTNDDGKVMSVAEVRQWLEGELAKGHKVVPLSNECEGFDFQTGCPGHPVPDEISEEQQFWRERQ